MKNMMGARNGRLYKLDECSEWQIMEVNTFMCYVYSTDTGYALLPAENHGDHITEYRVSELDNMGTNSFTEQKINQSASKGPLIYDGKIYFMNAKKGIDAAYIGILNIRQPKGKIDIQTFNEFINEPTSHSLIKFYTHSDDRYVALVGKKENYLFDSLDQIKEYGKYYPYLEWIRYEEGDEE